MTVTTLNNKDYGTGDGVMTVFPFTFRLQQASDLKVYVSGALVLTGYTVAINASGVGGNVTFTVAPANLAPIVFVRLVTLTQALSLPVEANFSEVDITNALDKLTMEVQQNAEAIGRSITLPVTSSISGLTLPNPSALKVLRWNATADALENVDINVTGGGILGPGVSNANRPVLWNATNGSLVKNATNDNGVAGAIWTSNGPTAEPTFQVPAANAGALTNGCRLSASNTLSNPTNDVTGATNVYLLPHKHDKISLYSGSGSAWNDRVITSLALALAPFGVARIVDVHVWDNAGVAAIEGTAWDSGGQVSANISSVSLALPCVITTSAAHGMGVGAIIAIAQGTSTGTVWTDADRKITNKFFKVSAVTSTTLTLENVDTSSLTATAYTNAKVYKIPSARTTAAVKQNGVWSKFGALTRRLVGTVYIDTTGGTNDTVSLRHVSNVDNIEPATWGCEDTTASYLPSNTGLFFPRTNSTALAKTRCEAVFALDGVAGIDFTDSFDYSAVGGGGASLLGIDTMFPASLSTWQGVLEYPVSAFSGNANYTIYSAYSNSGTRKFAAGLHFIQQMQYGIGITYHGRAYTGNPLQSAVKASILR